MACDGDIYHEVPNGLAKIVFNGKTSSPPSHRWIIQGLLCLQGTYVRVNALMLLCQSPAPQNFLNTTIFSQGLPMWIQEFKPLLLVLKWCLFPSTLFNWQVSSEVVDFRQKRPHPQGNTCKNPSWARKQPAVGTACLKKASQEACGFFSACPETVYQQLAVFRLHNRANIFHKLECKQCFAIRESALLYCSPHFLSNALTNEKNQFNRKKQTGNTPKIFCLLIRVL